MRFHLYDHIPGAWPGWTLAVLATTKRDADHYMSIMYMGGNYKYKGMTDVPNGAHCGAVTNEAHRRLAATRAEAQP